MTTENGTDLAGLEARLAQLEGRVASLVEAVGVSSSAQGENQTSTSAEDDGERRARAFAGSSPVVDSDIDRRAGASLDWKSAGYGLEIAGWKDGEAMNSMDGDCSALVRRGNGGTAYLRLSGTRVDLVANLVVTADEIRFTPLRVFGLPDFQALDDVRIPLRLCPSDDTEILEESSS